MSCFRSQYRYPPKKSQRVALWRGGVASVRSMPLPNDPKLYLKTSSRRCFPAFIPCFLPLFAKRTQLSIFPKLFMQKHLYIFQLGSFGKNTFLYRESPPTGTKAGVAAVSAASERRLSNRSSYVKAELDETRPCCAEVAELPTYTTPVLVKELVSLYSPRNAASSKNIEFR